MTLEAIALYFFELSISEKFSVFGVSILVLGINLLGNVIINLAELTRGSRSRKLQLVSELSRQGHHLCLIALTGCVAIAQLYEKAGPVDQGAVSLLVTFTVLVTVAYFLSCVSSAVSVSWRQTGVFGVRTWLNTHVPMTCGLVTIAFAYLILSWITAGR